MQIETLIANITEQARRLQLCVQELLDKGLGQSEYECAEVLSHLSGVCQISSEGVLALCSPSVVLSARPITRSLLESTARFAYLSDAVKSNRDSRTREYRNTLPIYSRLDHHKRTSFALQHANLDADLKKFVRLRLLPDDIVRMYEEAIRSQNISEVRNRWSFSNIVDTLSSPSNERSQFWRACKAEYGVGNRAVHSDPVHVEEVRLIYQQPDNVQRDLLQWRTLVVAHEVMMYAQIRAEAIVKITDSAVRKSVNIPAHWEGTMTLLEKFMRDAQSACGAYL